MLTRLLEMLSITRENELACDEAYRFFDEMAEAVRNGHAVPSMLNQAEHHVRLCPECKEEFETILRMLEATSGMV